MMLVKKNYIIWVLVFLLYVYAFFQSKNNNQSLLQWAWKNEPWFFFLLMVMFPGMIALIYWIVRKIYNSEL